MVYITRNLRPAPECMSVSDKILPPLMLFKKSLVTLPISGFLVLALTSIPIYGLAIFRAGFNYLFQVV